MDDIERAKRIQEQFDNMQALKADYNTTFSSDSGQRVLADLRKRGFFNKTTYAPGLDNIGIGFREGQRSLILHIDNMMNLNLEVYKKQLEQNKEG